VLLLETLGIRLKVSSAPRWERRLESLLLLHHHVVLVAVVVARNVLYLSILLLGVQVRAAYLLKVTEVEQHGLQKAVEVHDFLAEEAAEWDVPRCLK
jgi:hypothetical protein